MKCKQLLSTVCEWMVLTSQQFVMNCSIITGDSLAQQEPDPAFNRDYPMISLKKKAAVGGLVIHYQTFS